MSQTKDKEKLKIKYLTPKTKLESERRRRFLTAKEVAGWVGLSREHYSKKEKGEFPFYDYEMSIIAEKFNMTENELFFEE